MRWVADRSGRLATRPHYGPEEIERECETLVADFLGRRHRRGVAYPLDTDDLTVLVPAFVVTELLEAFALGFALYLPFLIIDLVVSNVLLALGMQMTSPNQVSLPFKLLLFVAIDGWGLLAQVLVTGYKPG